MATASQHIIIYDIVNTTVYGARGRMMRTMLNSTKRNASAGESCTYWGSVLNITCMEL